MKQFKTAFVILGLIFISNASFSQYKLGIEIVRLRNNKGNIMLQLFDENQKVIEQLKGSIEENKCTFFISGLAPGKYAVRYYHDENMNGKMETNLVGKPTEGYGFSNNVTGKFGPPPFVKQLFKIDADTTITLFPSY